MVLFYNNNLLTIMWLHRSDEYSSESLKNLINFLKIATVKLLNKSFLKSIEKY